MTRNELIERLTKIERKCEGISTAARLRGLIDEIKDQGVLDVQAPADVAENIGGRSTGRPAGYVAPKLGEDE